MKRLLGISMLVGVLLASSTSCYTPSDLRLNQMQVIGTHNSYHIEPSPEKLALMLQFRPDAYLLQYTHPPLDQQLESEGVRQFELDIFADSTGNLWAPMGRPGFKVAHIEQVDMDSTCPVFVDCLALIKSWSDSHRDHVPITIMLEVKDDADIPVLPDPEIITAALMDEIDTEIRSVFPPDRLITPDDIRGTHATLEGAVLSDGWPKLTDVRGKVMFMVDGHRDKYIVGHPNLEGRAGFTSSSPGQPDAAIIKRDDPTGANQAQIKSLVQQGYLVRTRADDPVSTPQSGSTAQRDAALSSGAQWVSTDYPVAGLATRFNGSTYLAQIPGGTPGRCNPVNAPVGCTNGMVESNTAPNP